MVKKTKEFITYETRETRQWTIVRKTRRIAYRWCGQCSANALMLSPEEAAIFRGVSEREIYREIGNGESHFDESSDQGILICCSIADLSDENFIALP